MNDKSENKNSGSLPILGFSLGYYLFCTVGISLVSVIVIFLDGFFGKAAEVIFFPIPWVTAFIVFLTTFKSVYKATGERFRRVVFIQSGGIFTILHIVFLILKTIAYAIYKSVKESYVIPNFTVEQIESGRDFYNNISEITRIFSLIYLVYVPISLVVAAVISWIRSNKNQQENDKNIILSQYNKR